MKRWIHSATDIDVEELFWDMNKKNFRAKLDDLPSSAVEVKTISELNRGDFAVTPNPFGSGFIILKVGTNNRAVDSVLNGYNLIEQPSYNRVVAERNGEKTQVYVVRL